MVRDLCESAMAAMALLSTSASNAGRQEPRLQLPNALHPKSASTVLHVQRCRLEGQFSVSQNTLRLISFSSQQLSEFGKQAAAGAQLSFTLGKESRPV